MIGLAPLPWSIDEEAESYCPWTNAVGIRDAEGALVCWLTRGYEDGPSLKNAQLIVEAVNAK